jgi:hypothetical protein
MTQQDIRTISFYHGTSSHAATRILTQGARDITEDYRANAVAGDLWSALLRQSGDRHKTVSFLEAAGCPDPVGASLLLESAANGTQNGLMAYGSFYATMNFEAARDYAIRSPTGSELLTVLAMTVDALTNAGDAEVLSMPQKYPELFAAISHHGRPVVLELQGIEGYRIAREDGNADYQSLVKLALQMAGVHGVQFAACFRIAAVKPADVVAVYNLQQSVGVDQSSPMSFERVIPEHWLSQQSLELR